MPNRHVFPFGSPERYGPPPGNSLPNGTPCLRRRNGERQRTSTCAFPSKKPNEIFPESGPCDGTFLPSHEQSRRPSTPEFPPRAGFKRPGRREELFLKRIRRCGPVDSAGDAECPCCRSRRYTSLRETIPLRVYPPRTTQKNAAQRHRRRIGTVPEERTGFRRRNVPPGGSVYFRKFRNGAAHESYARNVSANSVSMRAKIASGASISSCAPVQDTTRNASSAAACSRYTSRTRR